MFASREPDGFRLGSSGSHPLLVVVDRRGLARLNPGALWNAAGVRPRPLAAGGVERSESGGPGIVRWRRGGPAASIANSGIASLQGGVGPAPAVVQIQSSASTLASARQENARRRATRRGAEQDLATYGFLRREHGSTYALPARTNRPPVSERVGSQLRPGVAADRAGRGPR